ncbi:MAG: nuclear transport factor 2 family protein [Chitinophagaceae bacterium]
MKTKIYLPVALLSLVLGCSENTSTNTTGPDTSKSQEAISSKDVPGNISEDKTKQVLNHHWEAFTENKLDEVMADYTEESVLITPDSTFKGLRQIRNNFEEAYKKFPKDKSVFQLNKTVIDRDVAYILWQSKTPAFNLSYATDTFIIQNGKIIRQTYAGVTTALQ